MKDSSQSSKLFLTFSRLCTYEVVLRDHFKFRKNLDSAQWLLLGRELDRRQRHGRKCLVSLSGVQLKPHLVMKNIRRARRELDKGKLKIRKCNRSKGFSFSVASYNISGNQEQLPEFVAIATDPSEPSGPTPSVAMTVEAQDKTATSTLDPSPRNTNAVLRPRTWPHLCANHAVSSSDSRQPVSIVPTANRQGWNPAEQEPQTNPQVGSLDYNLMRILLDYPVERAHAEIRATVPSKQLVLLLRDFSALSCYYSMCNEAY